MMTGALHVHSTYSDGEFTLRELRDLFVSAGCAFACMTDHAEAFDAGTLAAYVRECESLSDGDFRFVAGLEYACVEGMHVLGYGTPSLVTTLDPQAVIRHVGREGGVSVIAHPKDSFFPWIETFAALPDGIESWNTKYDGRYAPRPATFDLVRRLQARKPGLLAFYGQDLHWKMQPRELFTEAACPALDREPILAALARGDFAGRHRGIVLPSSGHLPSDLRERFGRLQSRSRRMRQAARRVKDLAGRLGLTVPEPLKARLRKIF